MIYESQNVHQVYRGETLETPVCIHHIPYRWLRSGEFTNDDLETLLEQYPQKPYTYLTVNEYGADKDLMLEGKRKGLIETYLEQQEDGTYTFEDDPLEDFTQEVLSLEDSGLVFSSLPLLDEHLEDDRRIVRSEAVVEYIQRNRREPKLAKKPGNVINLTIPFEGGDFNLSESAEEILEKIEGLTPTERREANINPIPRERLTQDFGGLIFDRYKNVEDDGSPFDFQEPAMRKLAYQMASMPIPYGRHLMVFPTGSGKTNMQERMIRVATDHGYRNIVYVTSRIHSLEQKRERFDRTLAGLSKSCVYTNANDEIMQDTQLILTLPESLKRTLGKMRDKGLLPPLIVLDEGHYFLYSRDDWFGSLPLENTVVSAWTATPGLGQTLDDIGYARAAELSIQEGMQRKALAEEVQIRRYRYKLEETLNEWLTAVEDMGAVANPEVVERLLNDPNYVDTVVALVENEIYSEGESEIKPTIIRAYPTSQAIKIYNRLISSSTLPDFLKGRIAIVTQGYTITTHPEIDNNPKAILDAAEKGDIDILINVNMLVDSVDLPRFENLIYFPTMRSDILLPQLIGRVMRRFGDKTVRLFEVSALRDPDHSGFYTSLSHFGVSRYHPDVIYRGNASHYEREVSRQPQSPQCDFPYLTSGYELLSSYRLSPATRQALLKRHLRLGEYEKVSEALYEILKTYILTEGNPGCVKIVSSLDYGVRFVLSGKQLKTVFGVSADRLISKIPEEDLIWFLLEAEDSIRARHNQTPRPTSHLQSPESLLRKLSELDDEKKSSRHIQVLTAGESGVAAMALDELITHWSKSGVVAPDIHTFAMFVNKYRVLHHAHSEINRIYGDQEHAFMIPLEDFLAKYSLTTMDMILNDIDEMLVQYCLQMLQNWIEENHCYLIPPKRQNPYTCKAVFNVTPNELNELSRTVREFSRTILSSQTFRGNDYEDVTMARVSSSAYTNYVIYRAEEILRAAGADIREPDYIDKETVVRYFRDRMEALGMESFADIPPLVEKDAFFKAFMIIPGSLKSMLRPLGTTPREVIIEAITSIDEGFAISRKLYDGIESAEELIDRLDRYARETFELGEVEKITSGNFYRYFPIPPLLQGFGTSKVKIVSLTSVWTMELLLQRLGVAPGELIDKLNLRLGLETEDPYPNEEMVRKIFKDGIGRYIAKNGFNAYFDIRYWGGKGIRNEIYGVVVPQPKQNHGWFNQRFNIYRMVEEIEKEIEEETQIPLSAMKVEDLEGFRRLCLALMIFSGYTPSQLNSLTRMRLFDAIKIRPGRLLSTYATLTGDQTFSEFAYLKKLLTEFLPTEPK